MTATVEIRYTAMGGVVRDVTSKVAEQVSVRDFGAVGDGSTDDTAKFAAARAAAANGKYLIPPGTYQVDATPDPWSDSFYAPYGGTYLKIGGVTYDISGSFGSGWRILSNTQRYLTWAHARTGKTIAIWSDGESSGDSHRFFLPFDVRRDSHVFIASPETNGGTCDVLLRRSQANADVGGNRFSISFDEANDRLQHSYATTASGSPAFDTFMRCVAGTTPKLEFPALSAQFNQGLSVKQRAAGGFEVALQPTSSTQAKVQQLGGSATTYMTFRDGAFGFFGSTGTSQQTVTGSRGGNAALASLLTALANTGLIIDNTTA